MRKWQETLDNLTPEKQQQIMRELVKKVVIGSEEGALGNSYASDFWR